MIETLVLSNPDAAMQVDDQPAQEVPQELYGFRCNRPIKLHELGVIDQNQRVPQEFYGFRYKRPIASHELGIIDQSLGVPEESYGYERYRPIEPHELGVVDQTTENNQKRRHIRRGLALITTAVPAGVIGAYFLNHAVDTTNIPEQFLSYGTLATFIVNSILGKNQISDAYEIDNRQSERERDHVVTDLKKAHRLPKGITNLFTKPRARSIEGINPSESPLRIRTRVTVFEQNGKHWLHRRRR